MIQGRLLVTSDDGTYSETKSSTEYWSIPLHLRIRIETGNQITVNERVDDGSDLQEFEIIQLPEAAIARLEGMFD